MGIAVSGGGHRATVFGLGALLAVVDVGLNRNVTSLSSVSGGSIANGIVMTGPDHRQVDTAEFEGHIVRGLRTIATRAQQAIDFLDAQGYTSEWWDEVVERTSSVATTLAKLGADVTAELLEHGYVLTMVNTYVISGRGALAHIDRRRFREPVGDTSTAR